LRTVAIILVMKTATLEYLEKAGLPPPQARAIIRAMEMEWESQQELLTSKADLGNLRSEMKAEFAQLESRLVRWIFTCMLGQTAVLLGVGYFFLTIIRK